MKQYSFTSALTHFNQVPGWRSFLGKFVLAYLVLYTVAASIILVIAGQAYSRSVQEAWIMIFMTIVGYVPVSLVIWAMLEASVQRHYLRHESFRLRLGADELRLAAVALLYLLFIALLYAVIASVIFIPVESFAANSAAAGGPGASVFPMMLVMVCIIVFFLVRLSPAPALTIRDRKITFFGAWRVSRSRFWPMLGAYVIIYLISSVVAQIIQLLLMLGLMAAVLQNAAALEAGDFNKLLTSPMLWIGGFVILFAHFVLYAATHFVSAGVPALVAKTDPNWAGEGSGVRDAFS